MGTAQQKIPEPTHHENRHSCRKQAINPGTHNTHNLFTSRLREIQEITAPTEKTKNRFSHSKKKPIISRTESPILPKTWLKFNNRWSIRMIKKSLETDGYAPPSWRWENSPWRAWDLGDEDRREWSRAERRRGSAGDGGWRLRDG